MLGRHLHASTTIIYGIFANLRIQYDHCGYEFPWSYARVMPFVYGPSYHDFHHSKNVGNYATALYIFETLAGTNHEFFKYEAKQKKLDNHLKA